MPGRTRPASRPSAGDIADYLERYGYLPRPAARRRRQRGASLTLAERDALRRLQAAHGLEPDGRLDPRTRAIFRRPRCGVSDLAIRTVARGATAPRRWPGRDLNYRIDNRPPGIDAAAVAAALAQAFAAWAEAGGLRFSHRPGQTTDLSLGWYRGRHDAEPAYLDFATSTPQPYGHAFAPGDPRRGKVHFNSAYAWSTDDPPTGQADLLSQALHEIGHVLGLGHDLAHAGAVMYPSYRLGERRTTVTPDDRAAIVALYAGHAACGTSGSTAQRPSSYLRSLS